MSRLIFTGANFSYFYDNETDQYLLYWLKYDIDIVLKDKDAQIFKQQIEMIKREPEKDIKAKIEKTIKIYFYLKYAVPHLTED